MQRPTKRRTRLGRDSRLIDFLLIATVYTFLILNSITWRTCAYLQARLSRGREARQKRVQGRSRRPHL